MNESFNGKGWLDYLVEQQPEYRALTDPDEKKEFKRKAYESAKGFLVIDCADPPKYGQLQKGMNPNFHWDKTRILTLLRKEPTSYPTTR